MQPVHKPQAVKRHPIRIFLIVTAAILVSETVAIILISGISDPLHELLEVVVLTTMISTMIYLMLVRPLTEEVSLRTTAEERITAERDRLELVTSAIGAGLAVIDRDYKVIWSNSLLVKGFQSTPGAYCYTAFKNCLEGPCSDCGVREIFEKGIERYVSEHRLIDARGHEGWFQVIVTPFRDRSGSVSAALELILPIDDHKAVENALIHSQKRFQSLVESSVDWVWEIDANGRYTYAGPQCRSLLGYEPEEIIDMTPFELMPADDSERIRRIFDGIADERQTFSCLENCMVRKDGTIAVMETSGSPFFDSNGSFSGYRGIDRNISERKALETLRLNYQLQLEQQVHEQTIQLQQLVEQQHSNYVELQAAEQSLRQSEQRFRQLFEQNRDAILLIEEGSGAVCDSNAAAQSLFEGSSDTLHGMAWADFHMLGETGEPLDLQKICNMGEFLLLKGGASTLSGQRLIVSIWGKVLQLEGRQMLYCSLRDITERTRMEHEARQIQTKLIQTNKMTSLGFLVAGIAHEINNPNNNILLSAQLLNGIWQDMLPILDRRFKEEGDYVLCGDYYSDVRTAIPGYFNMITDGSRRIEIIINNLRDFTIKSKSELSHDVDINRIASISTSILQHQIKKHTRNFSLSLTTEPLTVKGNQQQLEQVIVNLIVNAIQALPTPDRAVRLTTSSDTARGAAIITVSDEGCGIPPEILPHIFEPFFSTKLETGGTGLGLAISGNIVKEHGGRLEITSVAGAGTTAVITLPVAGVQPKENRP